MSNELVSKGFGFESPTKATTDLISVSETKAMHEVQAAFVIAKKFPRNQNEAYARIMNTCKRASLAEQSMYAYPKGGTLVNGPSIRLAEAIAQCWGNIEFGIKEISQIDGVSTVEAYAIDLETNLRKPITFHVKHERYSKKGISKLTDPRDIYELVANYGARRLRNCILAILPGDVVEDAVAQCKKTLESSDVPINEQVKKMILAFDEQGVKIEQLEKRLGHKLDAIIPAEIVTLKGIYKSLKDGMAKRDDFFDMGNSSVATQSVNELLSNKKEKTLPAKNDQDTEDFLKEYDGNTKELK